MKLADKLREQVADDFEETKSILTKFIESAFNAPNVSVGLYFEKSKGTICRILIKNDNRFEIRNIRENDYERVYNWLIDEGFKVRNAPVMHCRARLEISLY